MSKTYKTAGGVEIECGKHVLVYPDPLDALMQSLDTQRGALLTSSYEYPGRYTCWDIGFCNPPLMLSCKASSILIEALNKRGEQLLEMFKRLVESKEHLRLLNSSDKAFEVKVIPSDEVFSEEHRSKQPSVFTMLRAVLAYFHTNEDEYLGFYGAFGYDLIHQFEDLELHHAREHDTRDIVLYLPDEIYVVNHRKEEAFILRYDFTFNQASTEGLPREGESIPYSPSKSPKQACDHQPGEYAALVDTAKKRFACGDLFEVVPSQTFYEPTKELPSTLFKRMREVNPSPYGFFMNLGEEEYLIGASPEMYVRVHGRRVETCPISGTIKRGKNAIEDAKNIQTLLESEKDLSELTMCTDVDRNDKSRICIPGSVQVIGRRQIEMYSRLIHTVDHVEGILRNEFDALDAFLTHMWVVTVTGAPKLWAMNFIEKHEKSPRRWYGGAVGWLGFNGDINTGLVLRTTRLKQGVAEIRVGATLLYDSDPVAEEEETRLKASAFIDVLRDDSTSKVNKRSIYAKGKGLKVLLIDAQDSFVHTLANYLRQTKADVTTVRFDPAADFLNNSDYDLAVLSPGPGKPEDFDLSSIIRIILSKEIPLFGVCLGLQGIVEYFNGTLSILDYPMHGKASTINVLQPGGLFEGLDESFTAGRYHSLYAKSKDIPDDLDITAIADNDIVMAVSHKTKPIYAVQFHPETILSLPKHAGMRIIHNLIRMVKQHAG
jgi:anthranilate synthase